MANQAGGGAQWRNPGGSAPNALPHTMRWVEVEPGVLALRETGETGAVWTAADGETLRLTTDTAQPESARVVRIHNLIRVR